MKNLAASSLFLIGVSLIYGTAGLAGTELELSSAAGSDDQTLWGWTAGAGVESNIGRPR